jgi:hypothetical protein
VVSETSVTSDVMPPPSVAFVVYGNDQLIRNALTEEKYKALAEAFVEAGFHVASVSYNDRVAQQLETELLQYNAVLVWVNPIEQGNDRKHLDVLLRNISSKGCFVSTHPDVILQMGTKEVLYTTKDMDWGGDTRLYKRFDLFAGEFPSLVKSSGCRVLKQYRGNGGNGVYKVEWVNDQTILVTHASGNTQQIFTQDELLTAFQPFFHKDGLLIDQEWNNNMVNGMVRCYVTGTAVSGFGYQEINALYSLDNIYYPPGKRYYFTEHCGLFSDLKSIMEEKWIPQLQQLLSIADDKMPVIWDADFFINNNKSKYSLCEINVSCVSPFPPSSIPFIVKRIAAAIRQLK